MEYQAADSRYASMEYRRCGQSGLLLPAISIGLWHNFGKAADFGHCQHLVQGCFDRGITHFDLANNYGPPPGSAEEVFGSILRNSLGRYRDELVISTKAGYFMWEGPYGEWGSRKHLIASADQSLKRMGLEYVDIFYHHRSDPSTPLEETAQALTSIVRAGKALYVGISNYGMEETLSMLAFLQAEKVPCLVHQMRFSLLATEQAALLDVLSQQGVGAIAYSPLAQGLLTGKYLHGIPEGSRAAGGSVFLTPVSVTEQVNKRVARLAEIAQARGQSLTHMALAWVLSRKGMSSVIVGASNLSQIDDNLMALQNLVFSDQEEAEILQAISDF